MSSPFTTSPEPPIYRSDSGRFPSETPYLIAGQPSSFPVSDSTIYYLIIKRPPINVIDVRGPFSSQLSTEIDIKTYVTKHYEAGLEQLEVQLSSEVGRDFFFHIGLTLTGPEQHVMDIQVHKENNADVKPIIRINPVWTVICTELEHNIPPRQLATIKNREVLSTFLKAEGEKAAKDLARYTVKAKLDSGIPPDGQLMWDVSGEYGVNNIYHIVGKDSGWIIEANLHLAVDIVLEGASDEFGRPMAEGVSKSPVLRQQYLNHQWQGVSHDT
jgi:hypothetical protein